MEALSRAHRLSLLSRQKNRQGNGGEGPHDKNSNDQIDDSWSSPRTESTDEDSEPRPSRVKDKLLGGGVKSLREEETRSKAVIDKFVAELQHPEKSQKVIEGIRDFSSSSSALSQEYLNARLVTLALESKSTTRLKEKIIEEVGPRALLAAIDGLLKRKSSMEAVTLFKQITEDFYDRISHANIHRALAVLFSTPFQSLFGTVFRHELTSFYEISGFLFTGRQIGRGAWGAVHIGFNKTTGEMVAMKKLNFSGADERNKKILEREVSIMQELNHSSVIRLYEATLDSSSLNLYVIMEYCRFGSLQSYLDSSRHLLTSSDIHHMMRELALGLEYLRSKSIVHRDLKLENILVTRDELDTVRLKLCDFAFARILKNSQLAQTFCGSPLYMAPEILEEKPYTEKADLWSVGVIMFNLLFDEFPYMADSQVALLNLIKSTPLKIPKSPSISEAAKDLLQVLLEKDPYRRISWQDFFEHNFLDMETHKSSIEALIDKLRDSKSGILAFTKSQDMFSGRELLEWFRNMTVIEPGSVLELSTIKQLDECEDGICAFKRKDLKGKGLPTPTSMQPILADALNTRFSDVLAEAFERIKGFNFRLKVPKPTFLNLIDDFGLTRKIVKSATLSQALDFFTNETGSDSRRRFILAHTHFIASSKVIKCLESMILPIDLTISAEQTSRGKRERVAAFIGLFIELRRRDILSNVDLREQLAQLIFDMTNHSELKPFAVKFEEILNADVAEDVDLTKKSPKTIKPKRKGGALKLTNLSALEVARQITRIDEELLSCITLEELMRSKWLKGHGNQSPNVSAVLKKQQKLSLWFAYLISKEDKPKNSAKIYIFLLEVASHLIELQNFNSCLTIYQALNVPIVKQLISTFMSLSKISIGYSAMIEKLLSPVNNHEAYRDALNNCNASKPILPILDVLLKDLHHACEGTMDFLDEERVVLNMAKSDAMGAIIEPLLPFWKGVKNYNLKEQKTTYNLLRNVPQVEMSALDGLIPQSSRESESKKEEILVEKKGKTEQSDEDAFKKSNPKRALAEFKEADEGKKKEDPKGKRRQKEGNNEIDSHSRRK